MSHVDESLLHAWLDDEVSAAEAQTVEEHLETCGSCQRMLDEAARTRALAGDLIADLTTKNEPDWKDLVARATEPEQRSPDVAPAPARRLLAPALAWAATLVFAFLLGWQVRQPADLAPEQRQVVAALAPNLDETKSELEVGVDRESLLRAPTAESQTETEELRDTAPELRALSSGPRAAKPDPRAAEPEPEEPQTVRAAAPVRKMAAGQFLAADAIERDQLVAAEQKAGGLGGERRPVQLTGAVLERIETVDSDTRLGEEVELGALRLVYLDAQTGVRVTLLQRVVDPADRARIGADVGNSAATATPTEPADGSPSLRWLTPDGVLLTLEADLDEAALRQLALRVR